MSQANKMERRLYTAIRLGEYQKQVSKEYVEYLKSVVDPPETMKNKEQNRKTKVKYISPDGKTVRHYESINAAYRATGISVSAIRTYLGSQSPRKIKDKYNGWRFEEDEDDNV